MENNNSEATTKSEPATETKENNLNPIKTIGEVQGEILKELTKLVHTKEEITNILAEFKDNFMKDINTNLDNIATKRGNSYNSNLVNTQSQQQEKPKFEKNDKITFNIDNILGLNQ